MNDDCTIQAVRDAVDAGESVYVHLGSPTHQPMNTIRVPRGQGRYLMQLVADARRNGEPFKVQVGSLSLGRPGKAMLRALSVRLEFARPHMNQAPATIKVQSHDCKREVVGYVNAYAVRRQYGGPEEGGWWYNAGDPLASIPIRATVTLHEPDEDCTGCNDGYTLCPNNSVEFHETDVAGPVLLKAVHPRYSTLKSEQGTTAV